MSVGIETTTNNTLDQNQQITSYHTIQEIDATNKFTTFAPNITDEEILKNLLVSENSYL